MAIEPVHHPETAIPPPHWELLASIFNHASDGIFVLDDQLRVILYNPAAARMTGWAGSDPIELSDKMLAGKACPVPDNSHFDPEEDMGRRTLLALRAPISHEVDLEDDEGQELTLDVTYTPVRPEEGPLQYIIGTLRDIGERRALEDQLIQSKKLASLGTLVAGIAHELRNPLGVILSAAEILVNEGRTQPQRRAAAHLILDETRRVDKSIKEFLAFARPRTLRSEQMDIIPLLQRSVELHVTHDRGCRLQITEEFEADLPSVDVDADQMRQVFDNLLANAEGSKSEPAEPVHLTLRARRDGKRHLRIDFADDGDGILAENLPHIHDPFFTTKREGTGLGLSIVLQIMTDHRGRLLVHSEPGRGTTFSLVLPIPEEMVR